MILTRQQLQAARSQINEIEALESKLRATRELRIAVTRKVTLGPWTTELHFHDEHSQPRRVSFTITRDDVQARLADLEAQYSRRLNQIGGDTEGG